MTQVILHGILAKEFRKTFSLAIKRPKEVFDAIACSYPNFRNRIIELGNQGIHFTILVDGNKIYSLEEMSLALDNKKIDIVPLICGHGPVAVVVGAIVAAASAAAGAIATFLVSGTFLANVAVGIGMMALQMALAPKPKMNRPESTVSAAKESFIFGSKTNTAEQGIPVPVGYGRLRVGSAVIQSTIRSYPQAFEKELSLGGDGQVQNNNKFL
jgi:predicted phage tail protein